MFSLVKLVRVLIVTKLLEIVHCRFFYSDLTQFLNFLLLGKKILASHPNSQAIFWESSTIYLGGIISDLSHSFLRVFNKSNSSRIIFCFPVRFGFLLCSHTQKVAPGAEWSQWGWSEWAPRAQGGTGEEFYTQINLLMRVRYSEISKIQLPNWCRWSRSPQALIWENCVWDQDLDLNGVKVWNWWNMAMRSSHRTKTDLWCLRIS